MSLNEELSRFDLEWEIKVKKDKALDKWNKIEKRRNKLSQQMTDYSIPYSERSKAESDYTKVLTQLNKASEELTKIEPEEKLGKYERDEIEKFNRILSQESGEKELPSENEADNAFFTRPNRILDRLKEETNLEYKGADLVRDYPYDECGRKLDLKEFNYHFSHKKLPIDCDVNVITIGSGILGVPCLKKNTNKVNAVLTCKKRENPTKTNPRG